ncbi:MAG TPA: OmpA family protein [Thauera sp.]|nr:OmpA family protein [Thauera sp.]HHW63706.1 OmpA family protein [Rhodocyclaceae bacterium]
MNSRRLIRLLPALGLVTLLAACATPSTGPSVDAVNRHALVRVPAPAPDWPALRQRLVGATSGISGIEIGQADKQGLRLQIPVADGFASGKSEVRPSLASALDALAPVLAPEEGAAVRVIGHTDSQGSEMINLQLSIARAEAVVEHLRRRGIALERLSADGRGEADPLTSNASEAGRARNRRVELILSRQP